MKKKLLNLRGISDILSDKEMKNVVGGSGGTGSGDEPKPCTYKCCPDCETASTENPCYGECVDIPSGPNGGEGLGGVKCVENGNVKGKIVCYVQG